MSTLIPDALVASLKTSQVLVVLTGAGVSAESGIPTFRDAMEGLWAKHDPAQLATPEAFERDPETVTRWYDWRREKCAAAKPNPAHLALAELQRAVEKEGRSFTLITQNVDRLHQSAGSRSVIELHGTLWVWRCTRCGQEREERQVPFAQYPPKCLCGGNLRPAVIWFGESLPEEALNKTYQALEECDLFFAIGSSAVVQPAASFLHVARQRNAKTVEINVASTPVSRLVDWSILGRAGEILPELVRRAYNA